MEKDILDARIAADFPIAWAKANTGLRQSRKRRNLRERIKKQIAEDAKFKLLTAQGRTCLDCRSYENNEPDKQYGYCPAIPSRKLCIDFELYIKDKPHD